MSTAHKLILVGDPSVGKTHLASRYTRGTLPANPTSTVGVEFAVVAVPLAVGGAVRVQIWDTAGQEKYRSITSAHFRRAVGALLVYDVTSKQTFLNANRWLNEVRAQSDPSVSIMLVGNKVDLAELTPEERQVQTSFAAEFAGKNGLSFMEVSAVTNFNVKDCFERLVQDIYLRQLRLTNVATQFSHTVRQPVARQPPPAKEPFSLNLTTFDDENETARCC